ncbi:MAG TPA: hypothetical protein VGI58_08920 [Streptosporangiaceae bacterium]
MASLHFVTAVGTACGSSHPTDGTNMTTTTSIRLAFAAALAAAAVMVTGATMPGAAAHTHSLHTQATATAMTTQKASPILCCAGD